MTLHFVSYRHESGQLPAAFWRGSFIGSTHNARQRRWIVLHHRDDLARWRPTGATVGAAASGSQAMQQYKKILGTKFTHHLKRPHLVLLIDCKNGGG